MRVLSFFVADELFAVDVNRVEKVLRKMAVTRVVSAPDEVTGIANLKGSVITIFSLCRLLGRKEEQVLDMVNAVVFKSFFGSEEQMGLGIDKLGELIDLDDNTICVPTLTTGAQDSYCICGVAELDNRLYRIIDIDSIINKYKNNILNRGQDDN